MKASDIVATTAGPALATNHEGKIVAWNQAAERLLGHGATEVVGRGCHAVLRGTDVFGNLFCSEDCPLMRMARLGRGLHPFELDLATNDGAPVRAAINALVICDGDPARFLLLHLLEPRAPARSPPSLAPEPAEATSRLTTREIEVLKLLGLGSGTRQIARRLFISVPTARNHVQNVLGKLGVHSRLEAVALAHREGLL